MRRVPSIDDVARVLRESDRLAARALRMVGEIGAAGGVEAREGMPSDWALRMIGRRVGWEAREILAVADTLAHMPLTAAAIERGVLSWSQARSIARAVRPLAVAARGLADARIGDWAGELVDAEPEELVERVEALVARLRADLTVAREDRAIERSYLVLQPAFDGGGRLWGEADAERFATIADAVDAAADRPISELDGVPSRAAQRLDALAAICEASLSGGATGGGGGRARPRIVATIDAATLDQMGLSEGARILAAIAGRPQRLSPAATEMLLCDADVQPVWFADAQPIAVGTTTPVVSAKMRAALVARDGGCRFPGCAMPAAWADAHHLVWVSLGGRTVIENLVLLCRRHHRRIHRQDWRIRCLDDGTLEFRWRGRRYLSHPRVRPAHPRE